MQIDIQKETGVFSFVHDEEILLSTNRMKLLESRNESVELVPTAARKGDCNLAKSCRLLKVKAGFFFHYPKMPTLQARL